MTNLNIKYMYRITCKYKIQFNGIEIIRIWATIHLKTEHNLDLQHVNTGVYLDTVYI